MRSVRKWLEKAASACRGRCRTCLCASWLIEALCFHPKRVSAYKGHAHEQSGYLMQQQQRQANTSQLMGRPRHADIT